MAPFFQRNRSLPLLRRLTFLLSAALLFGCGASRPTPDRGYEPGYIITLQGDTIPGYVKDRSPEPFVELYTRIRFREEGHRGTERLGPWEILGYSASGRDYVAMPLREETAFFKFRYYTDYGAPMTFLRVIRRDGPLSYYQQEYTDDDNDFLDFYPLFHLEGEREMVRVTQGILGLKRKRLTEYFWDCQALVDAIEAKELNHPDAVYDFIVARCFHYPGLTQ